MWQPWVGHYFPGFGTPGQMVECSLTRYVGMWDFIKPGASS